MVLTATFLIALGVVGALFGLRLFRIILPLIGFVSGFMVGFSGVQSIFGTGAVSTGMAILIAFLLGLIVGVLAFVFFELAVILFAGFVGASALSFLGVALGLDNDGFLVFMLGLSGAIIGAVVAATHRLGVPLIIVLTSFIGVGYVLAGFMLVAGNVSMDQLNNSGVIRTLVEVVDQSFLWFIVWVGASLIAMQLQMRMLAADMLHNMFEYTEPSNKKSASRAK